MRLGSIAGSILFSLLLTTTAKAESLDDLLNSGIMALYAVTHPQVMQLKDYGDAWNSGNIEGIVGHFSDSGFLYTDALSQRGIRNKFELRTYLHRVFAKYPKQNWTQDIQIYKNPLVSNEWAIYYRFALYTSQGAVRPAITGTGMERYTFDSYNQLTRDEIHLIFDQINLGPALGVESASALQ